MTKTTESSSLPCMLQFTATGYCMVDTAGLLCYQINALLSRHRLESTDDEQLKSMPTHLVLTCRPKASLPVTAAKQTQQASYHDYTRPH